MKPTDKHEDPEQGNFIVILPEDALLPEEGRRSEDGDVHEADPQVREHPGATPGSTGRRFFTARPRLWLVLGLALGLAFVWLFAWGWSYYRIPVRARPFHEDDALLRPSGRVGLLCAIAGTALMVLNLSYLLRKRLASVEWLGALRGWMSFHVLTGLVGPTLILFHAGFAPRSAVGILSFGAMLVVVGTGLMGRYLYALVPRSIEGRELEVEEVRQGLLEKQSQLLKLGVDLETFSLPESQSRGSGGTLGSILRVVLADGVARRDIRAARRAVRKRGLKPQEQQLLPLLRRFARERQGLARYQELRRIMGAWRFLHRWLAVLMFLVVMFHVAIAVRFGDLWILGGRD